MNEKQQILIDLTLKGTLIALKPSTEKDYPDLQKILSDPKTMEHLKYMAHLDNGGWTMEQIAERFQKRRNEQAEQTGIDFVIHDIKTDGVCGSCGFKNIDLLNKNAVFGIILHCPWWGKGIAVEACLLCFGYAFETLNLHRIEFHTSVKNERMAGLSKKLGISAESIRKEFFHEDGKFIDATEYAVLEQCWPSVKKELSKITARKKA